MNLSGSDRPPSAPREFRAAWVATVQNIDWPSKRGLDSAAQQAEMIAILDRAVDLKLNCLIVQVRTAADALYPSKLEPWSVYLSGTQGVPPDPLYDPLKMWIDEGHKRGIEIHAWFNPYRARAGSVDMPLAASHIANRRPDLVKTYGTYLWVDPGEPDAAAQTLAVFSDVVKRYDVDGIHIDDYFYPYPIPMKGLDGKNLSTELPFPDDTSWANYKKDHPVAPNATTAPTDADRIAREDWRRQNVNDLVHDIYTSTKQLKPWVKFGISPFGLGRPGTAPGIKGFDQYTGLYANAALWLEQGWCDYFTPQLYWPIEKKDQSFTVLLDYWRSENKQGRHVWPGLFTSRLAEKPKPTTVPSTQSWYWSGQEIEDQIAITRKSPNDAGAVHFSMKALQHDFEGVATLLKSDTYATDALVPSSPWLDNQPPPVPSVAIDHDKAGIRLSLRPGRGEATWLWSIWKRTPEGWKYQTAPGAWRMIELEPSVTSVVVTAVDRCGNESERTGAILK